MFTNPEVKKISFVSENIALAGLKAGDAVSSCGEDDL